MINDDACPNIEWSIDGRSLSIPDYHAMEKHELQVHCKGINFSSWVRSLNAHGFKKLDRNTWSHEMFCRGHEELIGQLGRQRIRSVRANGTLVALPGTSTQEEFDLQNLLEETWRAPPPAPPEVQEAAHQQACHTQILQLHDDIQMERCMRTLHSFQCLSLMDCI